MRLLLDTHILIWSVLEPRRLGPRVRRLLDKPSTEAWLSPVTTWELVLLVDHGQVRLNAPFEKWLADVNETLALHEAPLTHEVVLAARDIQISHADPADRLLAATARYYDLRLVTADERLQLGTGFSTLAV
jgi:PIN domain nuclease of toxin-antitoxin system